METKFWGNFCRLILPSLFLLNGCAISAEDLRANPHEKGTITVDLPYSIVFSNITNSARECYPEHGMVLDYWFTTSTEIEPGKFGRVEAINGHGGGVKDVFASVDVRSTPTGTEVDYYISWRYFGTYNNSSSFKPVIESWVAGNDKKCD